MSKLHGNAKGAGAFSSSRDLDDFDGELRQAAASPSHGVAEPIRMLRLAQVLEITGLGKTTIYELQKIGRFPQCVHLTAHSVRWMASEVEAWLAKHAHAREQ